MLPFELIITGTPVSLQTRNRASLQSWKQEVSRQAQLLWPHHPTLLNQNLKLTYVYYHNGSTIDVDNLIKPIQDGLVGVILQDDGLVTDLSSSKRDMNGSFKIKGLSPILAAGFAKGDDFIFIRIELAPDHQDLL